MSDQKELNLPHEFSAPAQLVLFTRYGDPRLPAFTQKWLTKWQIGDVFSWYPKAQICIHKHFKPLLEAAFDAIANAGLHKEIKTHDDDYNLRPMRGSDVVLSVHSWGAAIDMNMADNPLGSAGKWSRDFLEIMQHYKIYCGQAWDKRKDAMHFSMVDG